MKWFLLMAAVFTSVGHAAAQADTNSISIKPGLPAYLRQGDHTELRAWIQNHSDHEITGQMQLELIDGLRNHSVDGWFLNTFPNQYFTVAAGKSEAMNFPVQVPMQFSNKLSWKLSVAWDSSRKQTTGTISILSDKNAAVADTPEPKNTPLHLTKKMFLQKRVGGSMQTIPVEDQIALQVGDTIAVQLGLRNTEPLKQVHISDGLAAGTKLLTGLSKNNTARYGQKPDTASVNFFLKHLKQGTLNLRYFLLVTTAGNFSTGNTTVEFNGVPEQKFACAAQRLNIE